SDELIAEMAEAYGLAVLRDVPFSAIRNSDDTPGAGGATPAGVQNALKQLPWFQPMAPVAGSQAPETPALSAPEKARRSARLGWRSALNGYVIFRGAARGAKMGPYVSQFLLAGTTQDPMDGCIQHGSQSISHKIATFEAGVDYLSDWHSWLGAQNGGDQNSLHQHIEFTDQTKAIELPEQPPRFVTTPRDLAAFVRGDATCQPFLNAARMLAGNPKCDPAAAPNWANPVDDPAAIDIDPHLADMLAQATARGLEMAQNPLSTDNISPERLGAMLTLVANDDMGELSSAIRKELISMHMKLQNIGLLNPVSAHNTLQLKHKSNPLENRANPEEWAIDGEDRSLLLPLAYIGGSPMRATAGADHAIIAGACVTILKAYFDMFKSKTCWSPLSLLDVGMRTVFEASEDGDCLRDSSDDPADLTLEGELNKLAANIAMGRTMAGTQLYSEHYENLRRGERLAVRLLTEQMLATPEKKPLCLHGFDGERITIETRASGNGVEPLVHVDGHDSDRWLNEDIYVVKKVAS
ncbi:MAG: hypothetical protein ABJJ03_05815, partial [Sulfitobacter sp.]